MYTQEQVAATIDHAVLKPFATNQDVIDGCELCKMYQVASMCVRPSDVPLAAEHLKDSPVKTCVVVGFPHGANLPETKALETRLALEQGAQEVDMVMNVGKFLSGDLDYVQKDIEAVVAEAQKKKAIVKVIQETCYLSLEQVATASEVCAKAGADFVKTSTGFGDGPATPEVIEVMIKTVGKKLGVKASGGVRSWETAVGYLKQGCTRLGVGSTEAVLTGAPSGNEGY